MVRSICKAALGTALITSVALVGFAWSQSPPAPLPAMDGTDSPPSQTTMTVHENGKAIQCRLINSWRCDNGARAFQLEVLETGEKLTMVEDGPGTSFQSRAGRMRSLPMRIFHWGRGRNSPPGAPVPPPQMISSQDVGQPTILDESNPVLVRISPDPVAPPGYEICSCDNAPGTTGATPSNNKSCDKMNGSMICTSKPGLPPVAAQNVCETPGAVSSSEPHSSKENTTGPCTPPVAAPAIGEPPSLPSQMLSTSPQKSKGPELIPIDPTLPCTVGNASGIPAPGISGSGPATLPGANLANAQSKPALHMMPPAHTKSPGMAAGSAQNAPPRGLVGRLRGALNPNDKKATNGKADQPPEPLSNRISPDPLKSTGPQLADMARGQLPATTASGTPPGMLPSASADRTPADRTAADRTPAAPGMLPLPATSGVQPPPATSMGTQSTPGMFPTPYPGNDLSRPQGSKGPELIPIDPTLPCTVGNASGIPAPGISGSGPATLPGANLANAQSKPALHMMPPAHTKSPGMAAGSAQNAPPRGLVGRLRGALNPNDKKATNGKADQPPEPLSNRISPDPLKSTGPQLADMARGQLPATTASGTPPGMLPSASADRTPADRTAADRTPAAPGMLPLPATSGVQPPPATSMGTQSTPGMFPTPYPGNDLS
ncbi:MAG: hypothetical protein FJ271_21930, partial [Planctomycetes bacterium]|nr:hypothetical protein [Planctomycetota bacterium]